MQEGSFVWYAVHSILSGFGIKQLILHIQAYTLGLKYPRHLFLTYGSYESQWWSVEDSSDDQCSPNDRAEVLQFSLAALHYPLPKEALLSAVKVDTDFEFGRSCRDAAWTLAFALNKTIEGTASCIG